MPWYKEQIGFTVRIITDNRTEGEQKNAESDKLSSEANDFMADGRLGQLNALQGSIERKVRK